MSYRIVNGVIKQVQTIDSIRQSNNYSNIQNNKKQENRSDSFESILKEKINEKVNYNISKHANERLENINFTNEDMKKLEEGFEIATEKGSKNSVFIYKDVALVASVENNTIITAVENNRADKNCFTNIDSVVIL